MDKKILKKEIAIEFENIERLTGEMKELIDKLTDKPNFVEIRAAGSILHDFYCGVEKIFERIAININGTLPKGRDWHTELLLEMTTLIKGSAEPVINQELLERLKEYLRFRHLFRHIYGFELKWEQLKNLCLSLEKIINKLKSSINTFLEKSK